jgi:nifR3 family TIM-barrel protein
MVQGKFLVVSLQVPMQSSLPPRGFWEKLYTEKVAKGEMLSALAPMADVTDTAFREMMAKYSRTGEEGGGPDIMWTEFVAADGLASPGREVLKRDLEYIEKERPIVAQLFTSNPDTMRVAVTLCRELGFDGVDINMGCPVDVIGKQGAGAKLITMPELAKEIVRAAQEVAGDMPVSVKTRIGYNKIEYRDWLPHLLDLKIPALTLHLRTKKEMSAVPAHWELGKEIADFVREYAGSVEEGGPILLGNGDIKSVKEGKRLSVEAGFDGFMVGRGVFGCPWFFDEKAFEKGKTPEEKLRISLQHVRLFEKKLGDIKSFAIMKKHYKAYCNGFDGAKELRVKLMECKDGDEIEKTIEEYLKMENKNTP